MVENENNFNWHPLYYENPDPRKSDMICDRVQTSEPVIYKNKLCYAKSFGLSIILRSSLEESTKKYTKNDITCGRKSPFLFCLYNGNTRTYYDENNNEHRRSLAREIMSRNIVPEDYEKNGKKLDYSTLNENNILVIFGL